MDRETETGRDRGNMCVYMIFEICGEKTNRRKNQKSKTTGERKETETATNRQTETEIKRERERQKESNRERDRESVCADTHKRIHEQMKETYTQV